MAALPEFVGDTMASGAVAYPLIGGLVALDVFIPLIPSELILISAALVAQQGDLSLVLVATAGIVGAIVGDSLVYAVGSTVGESAADRVLNDDTSRRRVGWARRKLCRHGDGLIIGSRFLPLGRTAASFAAGTLDFPWRRFVVVDAIAAALSVCYLVAVGVIGGSAFSESFWPALGVSVAIVAMCFVVVELIRRLTRHISARTA